MRIATYALAPIFVPQALWVAARADRLPEAAGPRAGETGRGPRLDVLVLGDSSAAGVGVEDQADALGGRLAAELATRFSVRWQVAARSGATVARTLVRVRAIPPRKIDFVLVALGVNDAKNGVGLGRWRRGYAELLEELSDRFAAPQVCVSGLPPVRRFPLLPRPLRDVLGLRAERFDLHLRQIAEAAPRVTHLPLDFTVDVAQMARDGFHPGPEIYRAWAERAAALVPDAAT